MALPSSEPLQPQNPRPGFPTCPQGATLVPAPHRSLTFSLLPFSLPTASLEESPQSKPGLSSLVGLEGFCSTEAQTGEEMQIPLNLGGLQHPHIPSGVGGWAQSRFEPVLTPPLTCLGLSTHPPSFPFPVQYLLSGMANFPAGRPESTGKASKRCFSIQTRPPAARVPRCFWCRVR